MLNLGDFVNTRDRKLDGESNAEFMVKTWEHLKYVPPSNR